MKLTDALLGEHAAYYGLFDEIEAMAAVEGGLPQIQSATNVLNALVMAHARLEDELLFQALDAHLGPDGPLAVMRAEHDEIERLLENIEDAEDANQAAEWIRQALRVARDHFRKEEVVLFPLAQRVLDDETLTRLGKAWAEARNVVLG
jgi:iron-sulfur cluster repair protein YtfE (RIC family)